MLNSLTRRVFLKGAVLTMAAAPLAALPQTAPEVKVEARPLKTLADFHAFCDRLPKDFNIGIASSDFVSTYAISTEIAHRNRVVADLLIHKPDKEEALIERMRTRSLSRCITLIDLQRKYPDGKAYACIADRLMPYFDVLLVNRRVQHNNVIEVRTHRWEAGGDLFSVPDEDLFVGKWLGGQECEAVSKMLAPTAQS